MCADWGYEELHEAIEKPAIDEMKHAETLIGRLIFLEGRPIVSQLAPIHIGADVKAQIENDRVAETQAIQDYNADIKLADEMGDNGTREMLESFLSGEDIH